VTPADPAALRSLAAVSAVVSRGLAALAGVALVAMMVFTAGDVVLRSLGRPVAGSFEVIGWLSASAMALALGYVQLHRGHVAMTLVSSRLKGRAAALMDVVNGALALALFGLAAYHVVRYAGVLQDSGSLSETLKVIVYPWVYVLGLGFAGLALALLADLAQSLHRLLRGGPA